MKEQKKNQRKIPVSCLPSFCMQILPQFKDKKKSTEKWWKEMAVETEERREKDRKEATANKNKKKLLTTARFVELLL